MKWVEIFKTDVANKSIARKLVKELYLVLPHSQINIDLSDCDRILRIASPQPINILEITEWLLKEGYSVTVLN